jgi:hypothetical protein
MLAKTRESVQLYRDTMRKMTEGADRGLVPHPPCRFDSSASYQYENADNWPSWSQHRLRSVRSDHMRVEVRADGLVECGNNVEIIGYKTAGLRELGRMKLDYAAYIQPNLSLLEAGKTNQILTLYTL